MDLQSWDEHVEWAESLLTKAEDPVECVASMFHGYPPEKVPRAAFVCAMSHYLACKTVDEFEGGVFPDDVRRVAEEMVRKFENT